MDEVCHNGRLGGVPCDIETWVPDLPIFRNFETDIVSNDSAACRCFWDHRVIGPSFPIRRGAYALASLPMEILLRDDFRSLGLLGVKSYRNEALHSVLIEIKDLPVTIPTPIDIQEKMEQARGRAAWLRGIGADDAGLGFCDSP